MTAWTPEDRIEMRRRFEERWPAVNDSLKRVDFPNKKAFRRKRGWQRLKLWSKITKEYRKEKYETGNESDHQ